MLSGILKHFPFLISLAQLGRTLVRSSGGVLRAFSQHGGNSQWLPLSDISAGRLRSLEGTAVPRDAVGAHA